MVRSIYDSSANAVEMRNVSKIYKLKRKGGRRSENERFFALKDITLNIPKDDVVGILGTNGSGKSTLSVILSGISDIDGGGIEINEEQALTSINTELNNQLTGLESINVKGALLGLTKKRICKTTDGIIEFTELRDFLYQSTKKYSSGMKARLGFSVSLALNPNIFIVDEALSVGDKGFAQKCLSRMKKLRDEGDKAILFISHSLPQVCDFCKSGIWIEGGELVETGDTNTTCDHYAAYVGKLNKLNGKEKKAMLEEKSKECLIINERTSLLDKLFHKL